MDYLCIIQKKSGVIKSIKDTNSIDIFQDALNHLSVSPGRTKELVLDFSIKNVAFFREKRTKTINSSLVTLRLYVRFSAPELRI